ncbi:MAG: TonB-dependent receptor [Gemmatimonadaceae bacterium]|nr:TonB-dependent receptor [Gemmatimonadaceae bacterium]
MGSTSLNAQGSPRERSVTLTGVVRDSTTGEVLPNARVSIAAIARTAQTNADGRFTLLGVPATAQVLLIQYIGYTTRRLAINADTVKSPLAVELSHAVVRLATTNVVGATDAAPTVVAIGREISQLSISTAQVEAMPSVGEADVFRTLQMLPSVAGAGNGTASLSVRGGKADQNLVLLDGMTVYHVDHFFGLFSAFNTDALKDIQLYAGGFPARYGGRVSSVIDLTGKAGDEHQFRASGGASLLSARGVVEIPLGRGSILVSGRRSYTDIIRSGLYNKLFDFAGSQGTSQAQAGPARGGFGNRFQQQSVDPSFYFYDFNSKATYRLSDKDVATLSVYRGLDNLDQSQSLGGGGPFGGQGAGTSSTLNDITVASNQGVSGRWFRQWSSRLSSDALVASSRYESNSDRTANGGTPNGGARFNFGFNETNTVNDVTVRIDNTLDLASWSRVAFGVWNTHNTVTYDFLIGGTDTTQRGRNTTRDGAGTLSAAYAQHTWTPTPTIDLTTGVRANRYNVTAATYVEPRLAAGWQLTPSLRLKAAWGRYHQFVNRVENEDVLQGSRDFWLLADTALKPNASTHSIVGLLFDRPSWALNVEAYDKTLENATLFSRRYRQAFGVNTGAFFFTGEGRSRGLEFLLERKIGTVTGWASYTLAKSTTQFADVDQGRTFPTSQDQRHELKAFGTMQLRKWDLSATGIFGSGRPYTAPISQYQLKLLDGSTQNYINVGDKNGERLPSYQRIDLAVSRTIRTEGLFDWRVGMSLYNIANRRNVSFRKFDLSTDPMTISDVTQLGFTPSIDIKFTRRGLRDPIGNN